MRQQVTRISYLHLKMSVAPLKYIEYFHRGYEKTSFWKSVSSYYVSPSLD